MVHRLPKAFLLLAITLGLCILGLRCHPNSQEEPLIFRYNEADGIETLDPAFARNLSIMWPVHFLYNTLVEIDEENTLKPSLAKIWHISADGLTYTFQLRDSIFFHDHPIFPDGRGRQLTAADVVASFNRLIDPNVAASGAWVFNGRVRDHQPFEATDPLTFVLHLKQPFPPMLEILSMPYCSVIAPEVAEKWGKDFRNHPCGTGPFRFGFWDEGNRLMLYRNDHYWEKDEQGKALPYIDGVSVSFNATRAIAFLRFIQGELDFINGIDGAMQDLVLTKAGELRPKFRDQIHLIKRPYLNTEYLGILMNPETSELAESPLKALKVRQAINYAIDRQKLITYFRNGIGIPAEGGWVPPGTPGFDQVSHYGYSYQPQRSLELLKEAGYDEAHPLPPITLTTPDANVDIATFIADDLNKMGVNTNIQVMQKGLLQQQMANSRLPLFKAQWIGDYPDAETFLAFFYGDMPAPPNYTRFNNARYNQWYQQSMLLSEDESRFQLYRKMDSLAISEAPIVPLWYGEILHFVGKQVQQLNANALNIIDLRRVQLRP